jgi:ribosomal protein S18 acetylase RimI-like enzyme
MRADYGRQIAEDEVFVAEAGGSGELAGLVVLRVTDEGFLLVNVAVAVGHQGRKLGRTLLDRAEDEAARAGFDSIYLYTHEAMTENQAIYAARGYVEYDRRVEDGLCRVFMRKRLPPR